MYHTGSNDAGRMLAKRSELWMGCFSELNLTGVRGAQRSHHSCPHMNDPREGQQRDKTGRIKGAWQTKHYSGENAQCSLHFHFSSSVCGCTRAEGMHRGAARDSPNARLPSASFFFSLPLPGSNPGLNTSTSVQCFCLVTNISDLASCLSSKQGTKELFTPLQEKI